MRLARILRRTGLAVLALIGVLVAYEAYAVWRAYSQTDQVKQRFASAPGDLRPEDLTAEQRDILIRVEDPGFDWHAGLDFSSPGQGMTTITQALTKFMYFESFSPGFAKIEQSLVAWLVLDKNFTKDEQLAILLNHAYFGRGDDRPIRGFAEAARMRFKKPFESLEREEFIGLVGMLIGPNTLIPDQHGERYRERVMRISRLLSGACEPLGVLDPWYEGCAESP